jgi:NADH-quinone oxidoreductase subunit M
MSDAAVLSLVLYLPVLGSLLLLAVPARRGDLVRGLALAAMLAQLLLTGYLYARFDATAPGLQFETRLPWIPAWGVYYQIGLDGFNVLLVMLTAFLGPLVVAGAFTAIRKDVKLFYAMVFLLQFTMLGTFVAQDLFLFYLFWEAMLIPMFLIIGVWGGERRVYATIKFVLYTAFGSILMLAAVIYLVYALHESTGVASFAFADLYRSQLPVAVQGVLLAAFALSFAIKVPIVPLHTWLPDAHVEAPTAGSVILAGVLLKMGTYGFLKLGFPLFPDAARLFTPAIMVLAVVSIIYGACLALVQTDIKKIIAYSSISHLGYVMLGLVSLDLLGIQGAIVQMVSHGLIAGGLFLMVGMIYERCHSRDLAAYGGLAKILPVYSVFFMILTLAAIGFPTTSGFTGEFLVLLGAFGASWPQYLEGATQPLVLSATAVLGVVLGALYMLWFAQRFLFGAVKAPHQPLTDLDVREKIILGAIVAAVFALGLYPDEPMRKTELAARQYQQLVARQGAPVEHAREVARAGRDPRTAGSTGGHARGRAGPALGTDSGADLPPGAAAAAYLGAAQPAVGPMAVPENGGRGAL